MIYEKLKLQIGQFFVDSFVGNLEELEKVFCPRAFCLRTLHTFAFAQQHKANPSQKQKSAILQPFMIEDNLNQNNIVLWKKIANGISATKVE